MTKITDIPAIRFKGFSDTWEQRKLTEFVEFFSGLTYTPNDVQENGTLVLRSSNVSNGEVVDVDNVYVNPQVVNSENVKVGDIVVVVRNGSRSLIGKHAQIKAFMPNTVIGAFMTGIRSECPEFTNALLNTSRFEEEIAMNMGATINQITGYMFSKMEFKVPCLDEQKKIGEYFEKLDNLITLHQRKYDKLTNVKKSMLEKMFPQNGSNAPEIRFKGFTEAWEQRKLGEIGSVSMCRRIFKEQTSENGEIPFYKIGTFGGEADAFISRELFEEYKAKYQYPKKGDILISASGSIGRTVVFTGKNEYFQDSNIVWLNHDKHLDNSFLKCFYSIVKWAGIEGSTIKRLYNDNILNTAITLPSVEEQQKIGAYFENLDNLITLHQCKCQIDGCRFQSPLAITWEQRKVREVTDRYDNLRIPVAASLRVAGTTPYYGANGIQDYVDGYTHDGEFILVAEDGANDLKNYPVKCVKGRIWVNNHAHVLQGKYDCADNQFLAYAISQADIESLLVGGGRAKLNAETLMGIDLLLPNKAEQIRIGKYLAQLDNLITLHQRKPVVVNSSSTMNALPNQHLYFQVLE